MSGFLLKAALVAATYLLAWLLVFYAIVGNDPQLITTYFILGWVFSGLEMPTCVWLFAWPLFGVFLLAYHFVLRQVHAAQVKKRSA